MQEFLQNDVVSANLMSLTGYRVLVLLDLLLKGPCTTANINECFLQNKYIKSAFSKDTLRIYINSLRAIGCDITKATKTNGYKYILKTHPFYLALSEANKKAVSKLYSNIYARLDINALIEMENLFLKLADYTMQADSEFFRNLSKIKSFNKDLLLNLEKLSAQKAQVKFLYNSPQYGFEYIDFVCDRIAFQNSKLYVWGTNLKYNEYSYLSISKIEKILTVALNAADNLPHLTIKIMQNEEVKEISAGNRFALLQEVLENQYIVVEPESFRQEVLAELRAMRASYD